MSIKINTLSNWFSLIISLIIGFIFTPILIKYVGTANYGIWSLILTIIGYYGILDLGIMSASLRYISLYYGKKDNDNLNKIINTSLLLFTIMGILLMIISFFLPNPLSKFFNIQESDFKSFKYLIYLTGITTGLMFPARILSTIIIAHESWIIHNFIQIIMMCIKGLLSILVVYCGYGLIGLGIVYASTSLCELSAYYYVIRKKYPHIVFSLKLYQKTNIRILFSFGAIMMIIRIGDFFRFEIDKVVIGKAINMEMVGVYAVAATLYMYLFRVCVSTSGVLQPRFAFLVGSEKKQAVTEAFKIYGRILSVVIAGFGISAFLIGGDFLFLWLPSSFKWIYDTKLVFQIMIIGLVPDLMTSSTIHVMQALNKHYYYAYQTLIEGLANLILSIILVNYYGIIGVALGTAIPCFFTRIFIQPIYASKIIGISMKFYIVNLLIKPLCSCVIVYIIINYSFQNFNITSLYVLFFKGVMTISLYCFISYFIFLDKTSKSLIKEMFMFR